MEPFELKVQQVNFDAQDLSPSAELDSFSTVINFDSQFSSANTSLQPTISTSALTYATTNNKRDGRRAVNVNRPRTFAQPSHVKITQVHATTAVSSQVSHSVETPHHHPLINPDSSFVSTDDNLNKRSKLKLYPQDIRNLFQVYTNTTAVEKRLNRSANNMSATSSEDTSKEQAADNNNAFETVADALHLQWSVIGDKKLAPAPPEVVAQVVAEAERRLKSENRDVTVSPLPGDKKLVPAPPEVVAQVVADAERRLKNQNRGDATISPLSTHSPQSLSSPVAFSLQNTSNQDASFTHSLDKNQENTGNAISVTNSAISTDTTNGQIDSLPVHPSSQEQKSNPPVSKELIRVPPDSITRTTEKSSWFSSKPESDRKLSKNSNSDSVDGVVNEKSGDQINCDAQSVSSSTSELETYEQSETDKFLKTLPPFKMINLNDIVPKKRMERTYSPPVKETSFKPVQNNATSIVNLQSNGAWNSGISQNPQLMDSGIELEVETDKVGSVYNSNIVTDNRPSYVIPQPGPLFQKTLRHSTPKAKEVMSTQKFENNISNEKLDEILREKAKLEGQLEMLSQEAQLTLQERAELQAQVASLKLKLKSPKGHGDDQEKETLKLNLEKMQKARSLLEQSMASAQKILDEKSSELRTLQEELNLTQDTSDKLHLQMKELKDEMRAKEMTVQALKNKIAELYVEVQNVMQQKMESDTEARSARNELNSLVNAKNWYQHQLKIAQEARSKLQHELTVVQAQAAAQGGVVERLKTQNTQLQQQLKETQHKAIKEKEMLAKHLETIQIDMLDREAAFQEIQRERTFLEDTFNNKLQSEENEKSQIEILMQMSSDLENQLEKAHSDLKKKQTQIIALENDQMELTKKLALSQENIVERDNTIGELQEKLLEVEVHLKAFQTGLEAKESEIWKLKEEKAATEISLKSALEDKASVDKALENLKSDMGKVERSFRNMKQELTGKAAELESLRSEKLKAQDKLEELTSQVEKERRNIELSQQDSGGKENLIMELQSQKRQLEAEIMLLKDDIVRLEDSYGESVKEKENLTLEFMNMQQKLAVTEQELIQSNTAVETYQKKEVDLSESEPSKELVTENSELKARLNDLEKQQQKTSTKQKARVAKLNLDLKSLQTELTDRQAMFDSNIELLTNKLRETSTERDRLETELDMAHRKYDLSVIEQHDQMKTELQSMAAELETVKLQKQAVENQLFQIQRVKDMEIVEYQNQLSALDQELQKLYEKDQSSNAIEETNQKLSLELEKERGRVEGLMQTNSSLKQHVSQLEEALAGREMTLVEIQTNMQSLIQDKEKDEQTYIKRIQSIEESLQQEKESQRELRKTIGTKITENKKMKRTLDNIRTEKEGLQQDLEHTNQEVGKLRNEMENNKQINLGQQTDINKLEMDNKTLTRELERVQRELADNLVREPVIKEQIQSLEWQLEQKNKEKEALQEQIRLSEERQQVEIDDMKKTIKEAQAEVESLKNELSEARQEKVNQQAIVAELRTTLKASVQHHKMTEKLNKKSKSESENETKEAGTQVEGKDILLPPLPFDLEVVEKLIQNTAVKALESKPLDNLQNCLSSLKSEIFGLQKEMEAHTATVATTAQSFSSLEMQVQELQHVVKTVSEAAYESMATTSIAAAAVEAAENSHGIMDI